MKPASQKRAEAEQRQAAYNALTTQQKYDRALARGHAGTREARRLAKLLISEPAR